MVEGFYGKGHGCSVRGAIALGALSIVVFSMSASAVTSSIVRHSTGAHFAAGQAQDVVVGSKGTIKLGRAWTAPVEEFEDVWSINSIVVSGGVIYLGTSPNGGIFKYSLGELTQIYLPDDEASGKEGTDEEAVEEENEAKDSNEVEEEEHLVNEHIFAMATDISGRLLAGISGDKCCLLRFNGDKSETIFEPNDAKYIFAIVTDDKGNVYLGTGPEGKVYRFDPFSPGSTGLIYDSTDKNILSLAVGDDGFIYAGSDTRGLVYKINPNSKTATVLYDSEQPEVTALLFGAEDRLYAAATSAQIKKAEAKFAAELPLAGRAEDEAKQEGAPQGESQSEGGKELTIPNTKAQQDGSADKKPSVRKLGKPGRASYVYEITEEGYVNEVFSEKVVLFCLALERPNLLLGTGNSAQLFMVDPVAEEKTIIYEDKQASQITAVVVSGHQIYVGTANRAKLVRLDKTFASEGTYMSDLIDAGQPANWGKLQIEADIPPGCRVLVSSRSGNVKDVNDPTFSEWTEPVEIAGPLQLRCPHGRFCQYKLVLNSPDGTQSPLVREVAVASTVPNLAPKVESVSVDRIEAAGKKGLFKIGYKARDDNGDKLIYRIDFRKLGRTNWIELKDEVESETVEWDGKTVEDGRYEIRVTASDERSNTPASKLSGTRVSDPVVVDNTAPDIEQHQVDVGGKAATLMLQVADELSAIGKVEYTVDSHAEWKGAIPDDLVYDTKQESFKIIAEDLEPGEHVIAVKISDHVGNTVYKTFDLEIKSQ
jgi:hypothetical protein